MAQSKLAKGMKEAVAQVSAMDVDKAKPGKSKPRCKYSNGVGHGKIPDETTNLVCRQKTRPHKGCNARRYHNLHRFVDEDDE